MPNITIEKQIALLNAIFFCLTGAAVTLILVVITEIPIFTTFVQQYKYIPVDGWFGIWFILEISSLSLGLAMLLLTRLREIPLKNRFHTMFGYFTVAWVLLLAFDLRTSVLNFSALHYVTLALVLVLFMSYLWLFVRIFKKAERTRKSSF
jgi:cobalamin synthase